MSEAIIIDAFNRATTWQQALAAIKTNADELGLSTTGSLAKLDALPDDGGREQAIGQGVNAIKALFGPFTSVADIKVAVEQQIAVEHAKFEFITELDRAKTAEEMAAAIAKTVKLVNQDRQDLINDLLASNDPDAIRLAGVLQTTDFTKVLAEIVSHLDNAAYMADLGAKMLAVRGTLPDSQFYGDANIVAALKAADAAIDAPPSVPSTKSYATDEDTPLVGVGIDAADLNGDVLSYSTKNGADPKYGTVSFDQANGSFTYTPAANVNGSDSFTIVVSDGKGGYAEQVVSVIINSVNEAPTDVVVSGSSVLEGSANGTVVASLTGVDQDAGEAFSFTLLDNAGGRFAISGDKIVVADGVKLDYEQAASHQVKVQVTDKSGATYEEILSIGVVDLAIEKVTGSTGDDVMKGGSFSDKISGGTGNDLLSGGLGKDVLTGGKGKDTFTFDTKASKSNVDKITDFNVKDDTIGLENAIFTKLGKPGTLNKSFFTIGSAAKDKNDYVIYDNKHGKLYYDADGSGKGKAAEIAELSKNLKLTYKDFFVL